ncbi:small heat shock protein [Panaeolus papilionaceus]|nr:small heat shock protein [Panaeolus papilionaceus]
MKHNETQFTCLNSSINPTIYLSNIMSSVFYYEPFYDFDRFLDEALSTRIGSASDNAVARRNDSSDSGAARNMKPRMDLHEDTDKNIVTASFELAGLKKEDVNIDVHNNRLTVSGESKISSEHDDNGWAVRERRYGKFSRTLTLPQGVKDDQIKASLDSGVLTVTFPKASPEQATKKITVS